MEVINKVANSSLVYDYTGGVLTATLTADSGYIIESASIEYMHDYGYPVTSDFVVDSDGVTATLTAQDISDNKLYIEGKTAKSGGTIEITNNIPRVTPTYEYDGETAIITVTSEPSDKAYRFIDPKVSYMNSSGAPVVVDMQTSFKDNISTATATITDIDDAETVVITGRFVKVVLPKLMLTLCTLLDPSPLLDYYEPNITLNIVVQANPDTAFMGGDKAPKINYFNQSAPAVIFLDVAPDGRTASGSIDLSLPDDEFIIWAEAEPVELVGKDYGSINVYKVTLDDLDEFATKRFFKTTGTDPESGATIYDNVDLGIYVNRIKRIHTEIADGVGDVLKCGNYNTEIDVKQPIDNVITLDFGGVTIPEFNGDAVDFDTEIQLFLPFNGFITVPTDYVGKTIYLQYIINVITGGGVAKLICDDVTFLIEDVAPSSNILYRTESNDVKLIGDDNFNELMFYGLEPYIYCKWFNSNKKDSINSDTKQGIIGDFRGFNSFRYVSAITSNQMLTSEQMMIYDALTNGVYID